jgi:hypothetical protein
MLIRLVFRNISNLSLTTKKKLIILIPEGIILLFRMDLLNLNKRTGINRKGCIGSD